jgi:hypothetical protein
VYPGKYLVFFLSEPLVVPFLSACLGVIVILCWACVIFFAQVVVSERLRRVRRGAEPPAQGFKGSAPEIFFFGSTYFQDHMILGGFSAHGFLPMVFYFRLRN